MLIQREWQSMVHRFTRRNNPTIDDQTGFAPIFLQFLDVVHQVIRFYLKIKLTLSSFLLILLYQIAHHQHQSLVFGKIYKKFIIIRQKSSILII